MARTVTVECLFTMTLDGPLGELQRLDEPRGERRESCRVSIVPRHPSLVLENAEVRLPDGGRIVIDRLQINVVRGVALPTVDGGNVRYFTVVPNKGGVEK